MPSTKAELSQELSSISMAAASSMSAGFPSSLVAGFPLGLG